MGRPKIYDDPHFNLYTYVQKGNTYVGAYRNEWDPVKKRSHIAQRKYVGTLDTETGRVRLGKKYLSENPQYEGKELYYENKELVERAEEDVQESPATAQESPLNDCIRYGASLAVWKIAEKSGLLEDLKQTFGVETGADLLKLGIFRLLENRSLDCYKDWAAQNWLPDAQAMDGRKIREILLNASHEKISDLLKLRNKRASAAYSALQEDSRKALKKGLPAPSLPKFRYFTLDVTALSLPPPTPEEIPPTPQLKEAGLMLGVDSLSGDVCYACEKEAGLNERALFADLLADLEKNGLDLKETLLVADREREAIPAIQRRLKRPINFVCKASLAEDTVQDLLRRNQKSLNGPETYNGRLDLSHQTVEESPLPRSEPEEAAAKTELHLYKYQTLACAQTMVFTRQIESVLASKNQNRPIGQDVWDRTKTYIRRGEDGVWQKDIDRLVDFGIRTGAFAIRTNCLSDSLECLDLCLQRQSLERAFRQMKTAPTGSFGGAEPCYAGEFLLFLIAQGLRLKMHFAIKENNAKNHRSALPENSPDEALSVLQGVVAERPQNKNVWIGKPISPKAREVLELLGIGTNFPRNLKG